MSAMLKVNSLANLNCRLISFDDVYFVALVFSRLKCCIYIFFLFLLYITRHLLRYVFVCNNNNNNNNSDR